MEDLLKEILKKMNDLEERISQIEEDLYVVAETDEDIVTGVEAADQGAIPKAVAILNSVDHISIHQMQTYLNCEHAKSVRIMKQLHEMGLVTMDTGGDVFTVNKPEVLDYIQQNEEDRRWN